MNRSPSRADSEGHESYQFAARVVEFVRSLGLAGSDSLLVSMLSKVIAEHANATGDVPTPDHLALVLTKMFDHTCYVHTTDPPRVITYGVTLPIPDPLLCLMAYNNPHLREATDFCLAQSTQDTGTFRLVSVVFSLENLRMLLLETRIFTGTLCQVASRDDVPLNVCVHWTLPRSIVQIQETLTAPIMCTHLYMVPHFPSMIHLFGVNQDDASVLP
jgi:hypothetical protein